VHVAVYLPLLAAALLGATAPLLARRLPPATASWLLTVAGVTAAAASSFVLGVLGFLFVARFSPVAQLGHWSVRALAASDPVPRHAAEAAAVAVCVLAATALWTAAARARALLAARTLCRRLGGGPRQVVVVDNPRMEAVAVPGARGRIVVSRALLQTLRPPERRAVLAHETAHLAHHHHTLRLAADLAAAANPLLRRVAAAVRYATERWADESAAAAVGNRAVVARALARVATPGAAQARGGRRPAVLDAAGSDVLGRVASLREPAPRQRPLLVVAIVLLLTVSLTAAAETKEDTETMFERAMHAASPGGATAAGWSASGPSAAEVVVRDGGEGQHHHREQGDGDHVHGRAPQTDGVDAEQLGPQQVDHEDHAGG
jgi:peptidase M48-like protein